MIFERKHRLPVEEYRGEVVVSFTACTRGRRALFTTPRVVQSLVDCLRLACAGTWTSAMICCFMPDHLHTVLAGSTVMADTLSAMSAFKQRSGFWLAQAGMRHAWQKDFNGHVMRRDEDLCKHIRYIANNPVRAGLVERWEDYPFTGAIGHDLRAIIDGLATR